MYYIDRDILIIELLNVESIYNPNVEIVKSLIQAATSNGNNIEIQNPIYNDKARTKNLRLIKPATSGQNEEGEIDDEKKQTEEKVILTRMQKSDAKVDSSQNLGLPINTNPVYGLKR